MSLNVSQAILQFQASCLIWASWVLSSPMMAKMCNQFYIFGSREAYLSALAGILQLAGDD